jgi:tetratricopeptide (TPR) repeat protein
MYADELELYAFLGNEGILGNILQLNEDSYVGNLLMGLFSDDKKYIDKVVNMMPNLGYTTELKLEFDENVEYNLYDYIKNIDGNLRRNSNDLNLKYSMVELKSWLLSSKADRNKIEHLYLEEVNKEEKDAVTYFNIGMYSWYLERFDEARENFEKASNIDARCKFMCVEFLKDLQEKEEALSKLDEILEEDPSNIEALIYRLDILDTIVATELAYRDITEIDKELITKAIADSTRAIDLLYRDAEGYLRRMVFNEYAYKFGLDIPNARENALEDCRKLYDSGELYRGTAIWNIYSLGEIEEAFMKCTKEGDSYYEWMMLWDLSDKMKEDEKLAQEVEDILKRVININNVKDYNYMRGLLFYLGDDDGIVTTVLDNALKDFLNR